MRLRNIPGADEKIEQSPFVIQDAPSLKGRWKSAVFPGKTALFLEIGCGKGAFLHTLSALHPEIGYLGIEKMSTVLLRAVEKCEAEGRENLKLLRLDAETLGDCFAAGEVDRIYLNFSDPWPKDRHHKRRLTSREFLSRYASVLSPGGTLEFKTDNEGLFEFSLEELKEAGWTVTALTRDLHRSPMNEGNVMTEYEDRFSTLGNRILKLIAKPGAESPKEA